MITREYVCEKHGYTELKRRISDPTQEVCEKCGKAMTQVFTSFPQWGFGNVDNGIPNKTADMTEYAGWQRDRLGHFQQNLHPDNVGKSDPSIKRMTKKTISGKNR
jgi:hypothetical protein